MRKKWGKEAKGRGRGQPDSSRGLHRGDPLRGGGAWVGSMHHPLPWLAPPPKHLLKLDDFSISFGDFSIFL
jgi:hypothetical protein